MTAVVTGGGLSAQSGDADRMTLDRTIRSRPRGTLWERVGIDADARRIAHEHRIPMDLARDMATSLANARDRITARIATKTPAISR